MLVKLTVHNYAIIRDLQVDFNPGMTVITGESGSGKSIIIEALGLCLGERADTSMIHQNSTRATFSAYFQLSSAPKAMQWLAKRQLNIGDECLVRRTISTDGRSRAFINGIPISLVELREFATHVVQLQGQHAYQKLVKSSYQCAILDHFAQHKQLVTHMQQSYQRWQHAKQLQSRQEHQSVMQQRELIQYQLEELNNFCPKPEEYQRLLLEHQQLASSEERLRISQQLLSLLKENDELNIIDLLNQSLHLVRHLSTLDQACLPMNNMLEEASIQISESSSELRHYLDNLEHNPHLLVQTEQRIAKIVQLARKHRVAPELLPQHYQKLQQEWEQLQIEIAAKNSLDQKVDEYYRAALDAAKNLHISREKAAQELSLELTSRLRTLALPHSKFVIKICHRDMASLNAQGNDDVDFWVSTNPGHAPQLLSKIASGGELSRIALAIQLIISGKMDATCLIFDEIDAGISGKSALAVGRLLRMLGDSVQLLCVTHLPQIASCGHYHLLVQKHQHDMQTAIQLEELTINQRTQEIARLLSGKKITSRTLENARELLSYSL